MGILWLFVSMNNGVSWSFNRNKWSYQKMGGSLGVAPHNLKTQVTSTRYISAYYAIFKSIDSWITSNNINLCQNRTGFSEDYRTRTEDCRTNERTDLGFCYINYKERETKWNNLVKDNEKNKKTKRDVLLQFVILTKWILFYTK